MPSRHHIAALVSVILVALSGFIRVARASGQAGAIEDLAVFEGTWAREGVPTDRFRETCTWLAGGRRHLVCDTEARLPGGPVRMLRIYSSGGGTYTVYAVIGDGPASLYVGGPEGDQWIFTLRPDRADTPQRRRHVITPTKDRIRFVEEVSENGGPWKTTEDYNYVRAK